MIVKILIDLLNQINPRRISMEVHNWSINGPALRRKNWLLSQKHFKIVIGFLINYKLVTCLISITHKTWSNLLII